MDINRLTLPVTSEDTQSDPTQILINEDKPTTLFKQRGQRKKLNSMAQEVLLGSSGRMHAAVNLFGTKNQQVVNRTTYVNMEGYVAGVRDRRVNALSDLIPKKVINNRS